MSFSNNNINNLNKVKNENDGLDEKALLNIIKNDSKNLEAYYKLGHIYFEKENYDKAIEYYKKARVQPKFIEKKRNIYYVYCKKLYSDFVIEKTSQTPNILNAFNYRGLSLFKAEKYEEAIKDLSRLFIRHMHIQNLTDAIVEVNDTFNRTKFEFRSLNSYKVVNNDTNIPYTLGLLYLKIDKSFCAYQLMQFVTKMDPKHADAFYHLGHIMHWDAIYYNSHEAMNSYSKSIGINPKHIKALRSRGTIYCAKGEYENALRDYESIYSHYSKNYNFLVNIGYLYNKVNNFDAITKVYDRIIEFELWSNNSKDEEWNDYDKDNIKKEKLSYFKKYKYQKLILLEEPDNVEANCYFGIEHYKFEQFEKALFLFNKIILSNPHIPEPYYFRVICNYKLDISSDNYEKILDDLLKAQKYYNYSLFNHFTLKDVYSLLAQFYFKSNNYKHAYLNYIKSEAEDGYCNSSELYAKDIYKSVCLKYIIESDLPIIQKHIINLFIILPCTKCNDKNYTVIKVNSSNDAIEIVCSICKKRTWIKSDKILPDEYIEYVMNWIELEKPFEITISSNYDAVKKQSRLAIPSSIRQEVWRRDEGKCVNCSSRENLEYDHIIPVSKGGSNTARNIELLCQKCNREKTNKIQ